MSAKPTFDRWLAALPSETFTAADAQLPEHIVKNLRLMLSKGIGTDVTLICDGKSMKCHRAVLEMYSNVIATALESGMTETKNNEIEFKEISFDLLEKAIRFLYGSDLEITAQDVMPLLQFADMYDITPLREVCGKMLMKHVIPSVAMTLSVLAKKFNDPVFYTNAYKYCAGIFFDVYEDKTEFKDVYLKADKEVIIDLLSNAELKIPTENDVLDVIIAWVTYKQDERAKFARDILKKCVRCEMVKLHEAHSMLQRYGVSRLNDVFKAALFGFCFDLSELELDNNSALLTPCQNTREITALSCCVFAGKELVVMSNVMREHGLVDAAPPQLRSFEHDIYASYIIDNELIYQTETPQLTFFNVGAVDQSTQEKEICSHDVGFENDIEQQLLTYTANGALIKVSKEGENVTLSKMSNLWKMKYQQQTELELASNNLRLIASYRNSLLVFAPDVNRAYIFYANDGTFSGFVSVKFEDVDTCTAIASKRNIACIISQEFVYVIRLDQLLLVKPEQLEADDINSGDDDANDVNAVDENDQQDECQDARNADHEKPCTDIKYEDAILKRMWAPAPGEDKSLTSAVVYGQHLVIALQISNTKMPS